MFTTAKAGRVAAAGCLAAGALALLPAAPSQAVTTVLGSSCQGTEDTVAKVATLTADCVTTSTVLVPDGWTLDGAGHTITASSSFDPPSGQGITVVAFDVLSSSSASATVTVRSLKIDRQLPDGPDFPSVTGIATGGASATISGVDIENMSSLSFSGDDSIGVTNAVYQQFSQNETPAVSDLRLSGVTIKHYGTFGVYMGGGTLVADHLTTGPATQPGSDDLPQNDFVAPASVFLLGTSSASITNSTLAGNSYTAPDLRELARASVTLLQPEFTDTGSAVHAGQAGPVSLSRDTVYGTDSDTGILVEDAEQPVIARAGAAAAPLPGTQVRVSCSAVGRTTTSAADPTLGYGVLNAAGPGTTVALGSGTTFAGWRLNTQGSTSTFPEDCRTAVAPPTATLFPSRTDVCPGKRFGLFGTATPAAPGTPVLLQRKVGKRWRTVARTRENAAGSYAFHRRAPRHGAQTFRVVVGGVVTNVVTIRARCGGTGSITSG